MCRFQHGKIVELVAEYYEKEEKLEAGRIKGIPRWVQWGIGDSVAQVEEQIAILCKQTPFRPLMI